MSGHLQRRLVPRPPLSLEESRVIGVAAALCFCLMFSSLVAGESNAVQTVSLTDRQRQVLSSAKTWKIVVVRSYPKPFNCDGIPIVRDCRRLLQDVGWQVVAKEGPSFDALLKIDVTGKAKWAYYINATPSQRYTGADIDISAVVTVGGECIRFDTAHGREPIASSIFGGYTWPADAPFEEAYEDCGDFYTQLLSLIYGCKGPDAVMLALKDDGLPYWILRSGYSFVVASGDRRFAQPLVDLLSTETTRPTRYPLRDELAQALGALGDVRAVKPLSTKLLFENGTTWKAAVAALGKLGSPDAIDALRTALLTETSEHTTRSDVVQALEKLGWQPETTQDRVFCCFAKNQPEKLLEMKAAAVPILINCLSRKNPTLRRFSCETLGRMKDSAAAKPLCTILLTDHNFNVRADAAAALGQIRESESVSVLCQALLTDDAGNVRAASAEALGMLGGAKAIRSLCQALLSDQDAYVVAVVAKTLGKFGGKEAVQSLCKVLDHESANVRTNVVEALNAIGDAKAAAPLKARLKKEEDERVRNALLATVRKLGVQAEELSFEDRLRYLAEGKKWQEIRHALEEQPTEEVIEALKIDRSLVRRIARFVLVTRSQKNDFNDFGYDYEKWKTWWDTRGKQQPYRQQGESPDPIPFGGAARSDTEIEWSAPKDDAEDKDVRNRAAERELKAQEEGLAEKKAGKDAAVEALHEEVVLLEAFMKPRKASGPIEVSRFLQGVKDAVYDAEAAKQGKRDLNSAYSESDDTPAIPYELSAEELCKKAFETMGEEYGEAYYNAIRRDSAGAPLLGITVRDPNQPDRQVVSMLQPKNAKGKYTYVLEYQDLEGNEVAPFAMNEEVWVNALHLDRETCKGYWSGEFLSCLDKVAKLTNFNRPDGEQVIAKSDTPILSPLDEAADALKAKQGEDHREKKPDDVLQPHLSDDRDRRHGYGRWKAPPKPSKQFMKPEDLMNAISLRRDQ